MTIRDIESLNHDHQYARQSLFMLHTIACCSNCPPEGHAYWSFLSEAARYFTQELPPHLIEEETHVFSRYGEVDGHEALDGLRQQHQAIRDLAGDFGRAVTRLALAPGDQAWQGMRQAAGRLENMVRGHMANEENVLKRLARPVRPGVC